MKYSTFATILLALGPVPGVYANNLPDVSTDGNQVLQPGETLVITGSGISNNIVITNTLNIPITTMVPSAPTSVLFTLLPSSGLATSPGSLTVVAAPSATSLLLTPQKPDSSRILPVEIGGSSSTPTSSYLSPQKSESSVTSTQQSSAPAAAVTITILPPMSISLDGNCSSTVTCLGSTFGNCCSQNGLCGSDSASCGIGCQLASGTCSVSNSSPSSVLSPSTNGTSISSSSTLSTLATSTTLDPSSTSETLFDLSSSTSSLFFIFSSSSAAGSSLITSLSSTSSLSSTPSLVSSTSSASSVTGSSSSISSLSSTPSPSSVARSSSSTSSPSSMSSLSSASSLSAPTYSPFPVLNITTASSITEVMSTVIQITFTTVSVPTFTAAPSSLPNLTTSSLPPGLTESPNILRNLTWAMDRLCGGVGDKLSQYTCLGSPMGLCCGSGNMCGNTDMECGIGNCQPLYGLCSVADYEVVNKTTGTLDLFISWNGFCGSEVNMTCYRSTFGDCCGPNGVCGNGTADCSSSGGCQSDYGKCQNIPSLHNRHERTVRVLRRGRYMHKHRDWWGGMW